MDTHPVDPPPTRVLRAPLLRQRASVARYADWFQQTSSRRAARARELAESGVRGFDLVRGRVRAEVPSTIHGWYDVELRWSGHDLPPTPRLLSATCSCRDRASWCKHAMALAYHLADLS